MKVCLNFCCCWQHVCPIFLNQKWCGLWLCAWRLSFISFWANSRKARGSWSVFWSPPPVGKCEDDSVELKALLPLPTCSHCSQFSVISNYLSRNQLAMVMRKHAEHDRGSWFSFLFLQQWIWWNYGAELEGLFLKIQQDCKLELRRHETGLSLFSISQLRNFSEFHRQVGSTRRHQTQNYIPANAAYWVLKNFFLRPLFICILLLHFWFLLSTYSWVVS